MARLARSSRPQVQEIPDSYEQQHELSLSSSDVEAEDDDSEMIQHQLTQEQPEDDEDDDDDGAVNLFLPDIVDIVNKAASTPQKTRGQPQRYSSVLRSSPVAAKSSPKSQIEVAAEATQSTQSSTQSTELGHLKNYLRKKAEAEAQVKAQAQMQQGKQKSSPLRRPSSRSKPIFRSPTPVEENSQLSQGRADPYDVPSSPEAERRPTPAPQPAAEKESNRAQAGEKRKRKEAATVQRSVTPEEPTTSKRPRRGQDKPEYSPSSLRKVGRSSRTQLSAQPDQEEQEHPPTKRGRGRPQNTEVQIEQEPELAHREVQEEGPEDEGADEAYSEEKKVPVVVLPLKRTKSRQAELEADMPAASAAQPRSLRSQSEDLTNAVAGNSSARSAHECSKCYSTQSSHWHTNLRNEPKNGKHYCNDCYAKDYKKKKAKLSVRRTNPMSSPRNGLEILQSPATTRNKSTKEQVVEEAITQVPATQSQPKAKTYPVPKSALAVYREQQQQQDAIEKEELPPVAETVIEASSPVPETPKQSKKAKSSSVAPQSASPKAIRKPRKHFKQPEGEKEAEVPPPDSQALMTETELGLETVHEEVEDEEEEEEDIILPKPQRQRPKSAKERAAQKKLDRAEEHARWQQEQEASLAAEAEKLQKKKAKAEKVKLALAEQKAREKTEEFFDTARATRSRKTNGDKRRPRVEDSEEPAEEHEELNDAGNPEDPETAEFNMDDVPETLFEENDDDIMVEGDRKMVEVDEGQAQPLEDDSAEDDYVPQRQDDEEEDEDEDVVDEDDAEQTGGTGGISSILMNPSPKKVPSQNVVVPQRQRRTEAQRLLDHNLQRAGTSIEAPRNAPPPSAQLLDDEESASTRSQREDSPAIDEAAEGSATTMDFGRNPFEEATFNFTATNFSVTSRTFLKNMLLDRDVRELFQLADDLGTQPAGLSRKTAQARDIAQVRHYLVADYDSLTEQRDAEEQDEGVICDLYSNVFTNTRKLKKKVNDLIDASLCEDPEELSNGEQVARNKQRKTLLRDLYLFVVPDMLKVITALIETYCADRPPGIYCFDELHGLVRLTLELLRTAEDETNAPCCQKQSSGGIDYQYPKHKELMKKLRGIDLSCKTIEEEQVEYEKAKARERAQRREAEEQALEAARKHEAFLRAQEEKKRQQEEEDAAYERSKREKLRAWAEKNASILNRYKDQPIPRQVTQFGYPPTQPPASQPSRSVTVESDPFAQDIRDVQSIMANGAQALNPSYQHQLHVLPRRKPIVKAAERGNVLPSTARKHKLPLSNDDSDDDAFGEPREPRAKVVVQPEPRRKFIHHPITPSDHIDEPVAGPAPRSDDEDEEAYVAPGLDSEEEDLPEHPIANRLPRNTVAEEELPLTRQRMLQDQRLKMLRAELEDLENGKGKMTGKEREVEIVEKKRKIGEIERKKAEIWVREQEFYTGRDMNGDGEVDLAADLDEMLEQGVVEDYPGEEDEEGHEYDEEEEDQSVEVGTSFPGNNNRMAPPKPWTRRDLNQLITCLKFHDLESKYMEAADLLERDLDEVVQTAKEHKEVWAEEYVKKTGEVPEWVRRIGEHVACEMDEGSAIAGPSRKS